MATLITKENYSSEIEKSSLPVVIDIFAPWCGPCQQMSPLFEELSKELSSKYKFAKLDVDATNELAIKFGVSSIPTFIFIKNGKVVGKETGSMSKETLKQKIQKILE